MANDTGRYCHRRPGPIILTLLTVGLAACSEAVDPGDPPPSGGLVTGDELPPNPFGSGPLTALIELETSVPVSVSLRVVGRHGPDSDVWREFGDLSRHHSIPVLGLYEDY